MNFRLNWAFYFFALMSLGVITWVLLIFGFYLPIIGTFWFQAPWIMLFFTLFLISWIDLKISVTRRILILASCLIIILPLQSINLIGSIFHFGTKVIAECGSSKILNIDEFGGDTQSYSFGHSSIPWLYIQKDLKTPHGIYAASSFRDQATYQLYQNCLYSQDGYRECESNDIYIPNAMYNKTSNPKYNKEYCDKLLHI